MSLSASVFSRAESASLRVASLARRALNDVEWIANIPRRAGSIVTRAVSVVS